MIKEIELVLLPEQAADENAIRQAASEALNVASEHIKHIKSLKRSIDARGRKVVYRIKVSVYLDEFPAPEIFTIKYQNVSDKKPVLIVGAGPAGLFAAVRCIELGLKPVI
ncbi:MAG: FAD-binding protein, partial [Daejeonella sp.]